MDLMKKKIASLTLVFFLLINIPIFGVTFAEDVNLFRIKVEQQQKMITKNSITLEWANVEDAASYEVNYSTKDQSGNAESVIESVYDRNVLIDNLRPGIIYDFQLEAYNEGGFNLIGDDEDYKLKAITGINKFRAQKIDEDLAADQLIVGEKPGILLSWDKPFIKQGDTFVAIPDEYIEYELVIKSSQASIQDSVERFKIVYDEIGGVYHLNRWNGQNYDPVSNENSLPENASYNFLNDSDSLSFEWKKEADEASGVVDPETGEDIESALEPGSLYYIELYPKFKAGTEYENVNYIKTNLESEFADTYLKVKLERNNDDVIFTGYRVINDETYSQLPDFLYEFWVGSEQSNLYRQYYEYENGDEDYAEDYIEAFITNAALFENYYKFTATSEYTDSEGEPIVLSSQVFGANVSEIDEVVAPVNEKFEVVDVSLDEESEVPIISLRWDRPDYYSDMIASGDYRYHVFINSALNDLYDDEGNIMYEEIQNDSGIMTVYERKYREAFNVLVRSDDSSLPNKERLKIIDSEDIQEGELDTGSDRIELQFEGEDLFLNDPDGYPTTLKNNKVYYIKVCVSKAGEIVSEYSVSLAFVTPAKTELEPYLPKGINLSNVTSEDFEIRWDPIEIDDEEYFPVDEDYEVNYEISLSKNPNREVLFDNEDNTGLTKYGDFTTELFTISSNEVDVTTQGAISFIKKPLSEDIIGVTIKGEDLLDNEKKLEENSTYYVLLRTRLSVSDAVYYEPKYSQYSSLVSATTLRSEIYEPGADEIIPQTPTDFSVAEDENDNLIIDSNSVALYFSGQDLFEDVNYRIIYTRKPIEDVENFDGNLDGLSEEHDAKEVLSENIQSGYNENTNDYILEVSDLIPNTIYYFYLQAVRYVDSIIIGSQWVSIPVTTSFLETPEYLEVVDVTEDDEDYELFDKYHELKVKWKSIESSDENPLGVNQFDIAYKEHGAEEYTVVNTEDGTNLEAFKSFQLFETLNTGYEYNSVIITGLKANTEYDIKVRIIKADGITVSQYTPAITGRTDFSNEEYEDDYIDDVKNDIFAEKISKYKESWYWIYENSDSNKSIDYSIKIKGEKAINYLENSNNNSFLIPFSSMQDYGVNKDYSFEVFIPLKVVEHLITSKKNLIIRTNDLDLSIYYNNFNEIKNEALKEMITKRDEKSSVDDVYIKIIIDNLESTSTYERSGNQELISNIIQLSAEAQAFSITDNEFEDRIRKSIYGDDLTGTNDGWLSEYIDEVFDVTSDYDEMDEDMDEIIEKIDEEIAEYIEEIVNSSRYVKYSEEMTELPYNMDVKIKYVDNYEDGSISVYYIKSKNDSWTKVPGTINRNSYTALGETSYFDSYKFAVLKENNLIYDIGNSEFGEEIKELQNEYNISEVFSDTGYIYPEQNITMEEVIKIFSRIANSYSGNYIDTDISSLGEMYNLDEKLNVNKLTKNISREQAAYLAMKLYEIKTGADLDYLETRGKIILIDERNISLLYLKSVQLCVDLEIIDVENSTFNPDEYVSRGEYLVILNKVLKIVE
jgi:hypothetical protein